MKRGLWKKRIALWLAAIMCVGLAACGGDGGQDRDTGSAVNEGDGGDGGSVSLGGSQSGKENVYSFQELNLLRDNDNVSGMFYQDGKLYLIVYNWAGSGEESGQKDVFGCYMANADGTDSSFMELKKPDREQSYSSIDRVLLTDGGYFYAVESSGYEDISDPDNYIYEDRYFLNCWNADGVLQWSERIDSAGTDEWTYCSQLLDGGNGRALVITSGDRSEAVLYAPQGEESSRWELDSDVFGRADLIYAGQDGTLRLLFYNEEYTKRFLASYDMETGTLGEQFELPFNDGYRVSKGNGTDLLLMNSMGVYTWNTGDAEPTMLMNLVNSDLAADEINAVQLIDDQHFIALYNDIVNWQEKCAYFTSVSPADIPDKEELVLGGTYIGTDVKAKVIAFNKASDKYRITLRDYSEYNNSGDGTTAQTRLNSDIVSGRMPDIMLLGDMNNYVNYASKGALADVGALLAADPELGGQEYLQNVWDAYSVDGKLYAVIPSFGVRTMVAKKSLVGEPQSWTMADAQAALNNMAAQATVFGNITRDAFIDRVMSFAGRDFVDISSGQCSFNSQSFIDMLEYARTLPGETEQEWGDDYDYSDEENQYRENRTLLYDLYIVNIRGFKFQVKGYMGEEVSYVGFPAADSNGSTLDAGNFSFVISADSRQQEGAWQFVRQFLKPEYQNSEECNYMPVLKSAFLAKAQEGTERSYWINEDGSKEYYDDMWTVNGEAIPLEPFTQQEVDDFCQFIYTVDHTSYYENQIYNIIMEEAAAFFEGQKSVQETVDIIQSRAQIFVDENR